MKKLHALAAGLMMCGLSTGCAAPAETASAAPVREGLEVIERDDVGGRLVLAFHKEGRTIRYELLLGEKLESTSPANDDPELPTSAVDARILDAKGGVFYMQRGGDSFLDPSWRMPAIEGVDLEGRLIDLKLPRDAVAELRTLDLGARLDDLKKTAIQIGLGVEHMYEKDGAGAASPSTPSTPETTPPTTTPPPTEEGSAVEGGGALAPKVTHVSWWSAAKWDYVMKRQPSGLFVGEHSAVHLRAWSSSNYVVANFYACNHGACANWSSMSTKCVMYGWLWDNGSRTRAFYSETATGGIWPSGACGTLWGLLSGYHTCNSDSVVERDSIWTNTRASTWICGTPLLWAPGCH